MSSKKRVFIPRFEVQGLSAMPIWTLISGRLHQEQQLNSSTASSEMWGEGVSCQIHLPRDLLQNVTVQHEGVLNFHVQFLRSTINHFEKCTREKKHTQEKLTQHLKILFYKRSLFFPVCGLKMHKSPSKLDLGQSETSDQILFPF